MKKESVSTGPVSMPKKPAKQLSNFPLRALFLVALAMFATQREARAYTDPGTGALIWQMLLAGLVGVGFYFRRITSWFKNRKGPKV
ncbi:MAG: hypothetical protein ABSC05_03140 [Candidatus Solibacter sp.]